MEYQKTPSVESIKYVFTRLARRRCHRLVASAIVVGIAVSPSTTASSGFTPGRCPIIYSDWRRSGFSPGRFCVGIGYLTPSFGKHKDTFLSEINTKQLSVYLEEISEYNIYCACPFKCVGN